MGDGIDGSRPCSLPGLRSLETCALARATCAADRWTLALYGSHTLADLDGCLSRQILQRSASTPYPHEPRTLPLRAPSAVWGRNGWKGSNGVDLRQSFWMAAGYRLGAATSK